MPQVEQLEEELAVAQARMRDAEANALEAEARNSSESDIDVEDTIRQFEENLAIKNTALLASVDEIEALNAMIEHLKSLHDQVRQQ
jgi:hypothetical protein